jgi:hypothetical protein
MEEKGMTPEKCSIRYCRDPPWIIVLGKSFCAKHWDELCAKDHEAHKVKVDNLELSVGKLEEKVKTIEITVNDIRWGREHPQ